VWTARDVSFHKQPLPRGGQLAMTVWLLLGMIIRYQ
jgi:hypothetical protein